MSNRIFAQDIHFSQFYTASVLNNAANSGVSDNDIRVAMNYRNQWAAIAQPFNTYYFSVDKRQDIANQQFGIGLSVLNDASSGGQLTANKAYLSISYTKYIDNQQITFGIQPGFVFNSLGSAFTFGNQFNKGTHTYDPSIPSNEKYLNDRASYFDLNAGILWRASIQNLIPAVGFSLGHLNRPVPSFFTAGNQDALPFKYLVHAQIKIPIREKYDITPLLLTSYIPGTREMVAGAIGGYNIDKFFIPVQRLYVTNLYRVNPARNIDAFILGGGAVIKGFDIGLTYDFTLSSLHKANQFRGAFELSVQYTGALKQKLGTGPCRIY